MNVPPHHIKSFTYCNEQVRVDEEQRVMVYNTDCGLKYMGSHHSVGAEKAGGILDLVLKTTMIIMMVILIYGINSHITAYRMNK
jgi:hypothetical protein